MHLQIANYLLLLHDFFSNINTILIKSTTTTIINIIVKKMFLNTFII